MIAANGVTARFLAAKGYPSLRRVVRSPERWARIVEVGRVRRDAPGRARRRRSRGLSGQAPQDRSAAVSRPFARHRQADGPRRVRRRAAGTEPGRPLRPRRAGLLALDGSQPPVSRPRDAPAPQGRLRRRRPRRTRTAELEHLARPLHRARGRREQGRAAGAQVRRRPAPGAPHRPAIRRDRHRRHRQRTSGSASSSLPSRASSSMATRASRWDGGCASS